MTNQTHHKLSSLDMLGPNYLNILYLQSSSTMKLIIEPYYLKTITLGTCKRNSSHREKPSNYES